MWIICGILSCIFTVLGWVLVVKKSYKASWASFCALSFTVFTFLMGYRQVLYWVNREDWTALMDVVPSIYNMVVGFAIVLILANIPALAASKHRDR
jgi:uncharacterized membrane protein YozB (DUF420 family)